MKKILLAAAACAVVLACSTKKSSAVNDDSYGYSQENPIKVGGVASGPANERKYLSNITGPNGEQVWYSRNGSCCAFESKNGMMGIGMLDIYSVTYDGKGDTVTLYINMYDSDVLRAPKGFILN